MEEGRSQTGEKACQERITQTTVVQASQAAKKGQGDGETKWKGCFDTSVMEEQASAS